MFKFNVDYFICIQLFINEIFDWWSLQLYNTIVLFLKVPQPESHQLNIFFSILNLWVNLSTLMALKKRIVSRNILIVVYIKVRIMPPLALKFILQFKCYYSTIFSTHEGLISMPQNKISWTIRNEIVVTKSLSL